MIYKAGLNLTCAKLRKEPILHLKFGPAQPCLLNLKFVGIQIWDTSIIFVFIYIAAVTLCQVMNQSVTIADVF